MLAFGLVVPVFGFLFETENALFSELIESKRLKFLYLLLMGIFSVGTLIGAPVVGALSDKFGRKKMLFFNYCSAAFFYCVFLLGIHWVSYPMMFIARLLGGITGGSLLVVQSAIADVSSPEDKAKNFGLTGIAFGLGFILGAFFGGLLSDSSIHPSFGYSLPFYVCISIYGINLLFLSFFFKETNLNLTNKVVSAATGVKNFVRAFTNPNLRNIFVVIFLITVAFNFLLQLYQFYARESFEIEKTGVGLLLGFVGISVAVSQGLVLPMASKRWNHSKLLLYFLPLFAISYLVLLLPNSIMFFCATTFILLAFQGICFPTTLAIISNRADETIQGEVIGINQAVQSAAAACPIFIGALWEVQYSYPMYFGAIATGLAWLIFVWFYLREKKSLAEN